MDQSISGKYWECHDYNEHFVSEIAQLFHVSDFLARMISVRVSSLEEVANFLDPKIKVQLPDPFHLRDMDKAVNRVIRAIESNEKICIFADYDVDGATSAALFVNILRELRVDSIIYVPDRIEEGYGPNISAIKSLHKQDVSLIITVDCGSVSFDPLEYADQIGLDVIVIDHHISLNELPKTIAVINPNRLDETSDCKNLAAVGVSFLFLVALRSTLKQQNYFAKHDIALPNLMNQLDIVALGTVCDVMPLRGLNRAFVTQGLKVARLRKNIGLRALCDVSNIEEPLNCYHLGFMLGPRINAGGRVGKADLGSSLLSTNSMIDATKISNELDQYNQERKVLEMTILEEAKIIAQSQINNSMLFVVGKGWHPGVIGIVAGRLKEQYNKAVAVIALNGGVGKASCRSIKGIDFGVKILEAKQRDLLIAGGGHAMAAGFSVAESKLDALHHFLQTEFQKDLVKSQDHMYHKYDIDLTSTAVNLSLIDEMNILEPFGNGNPTPIFRFSNMYVLKADIVGAKHIRVIFAPNYKAYGSKSLQSIIFNAVDTDIGNIILSSKAHQLSVIGSLKLNKWQDRVSVQCHVSDVIIENSL